MLFSLCCYFCCLCQRQLDLNLQSDDYKAIILPLYYCWSGQPLFALFLPLLSAVSGFNPSNKWLQVNWPTTNCNTLWLYIIQIKLRSFGLMCTCLLSKISVITMNVWRLFYPIAHRCHSSFSFWFSLSAIYWSNWSFSHFFFYFR